MKKVKREIDLEKVRELHITYILDAVTPSDKKLFGYAEAVEITDSLLTDSDYVENWVKRKLPDLKMKKVI